MTLGSTIRYILIFTGILLLQVVVIDPINLGRYATPLLYVFFLMMLPVNIKPWATLLIGFTAGLIADFFSNTPGMHAFTMVFTAFVRIFILRFFISKEESEKTIEPNLFNMGYRMFFFYSLSLSFIYHLVFTILDIATIHYFFTTVAVAISSTLLSLVLIFLVELLFYRFRPEI